MDKKLKKMVTTALFMALICVATMVIQIPMPMTNGYVNLGDAFVLAAAWILGSPWGIVAAGVGSALADLLTGYLHYVPGTLIIKALMALAAILCAKAIGQHTPFMKYAGRVMGATLAELVMVAGYFGYAYLIYDFNLSGAASSVPGNLVQGVFGLVISVALIFCLDKTGVIKRITED